MAELDPKFPSLPVNRWPLALAALLFFGALVYLLQPILLPFVLGALIAYLGDPLADFLERRSMSRTVAVVLGFTTASHFTKSYKQHFQMTPSEERQQVLAG